MGTLLKIIFEFVIVLAVGVVASYASGNTQTGLIIFDIALFFIFILENLRPRE